MKRLRLRLTTILGLALACLFATGAGSAMATFTDATSAGANTLTAGAWAFYLHNNPTPPTANTTAQYNLTMTTVVPTAAVLYNYDTNSANRPGRGITRNNPPSPGLATAFRYVNWRAPASATALTLSGTITLDIWSAANSALTNRTGSLIAYLRDYNPGTGTYAEIGNATLTGVYAAGRTYYERPISIVLGASYTLVAGHQLEIKVESPTATSAVNMLVAYDTTTYPAYLRVR